MKKYYCTWRGLAVEADALQAAGAAEQACKVFGCSIDDVKVSQTGPAGQVPLLAYNASGARIFRSWRIRKDHQDGETVATISTDMNGDDQVGYARLFAAAPDLLAALEAVAGWDDAEHPRAVAGKDVDYEGLDAAIKQARAAIAKATTA